MGVSDPAPAGLDETLAALADPVRRRVVELLVERPRRAGELARELGTAPSAMSKHLRVLRQSGLVTETHPEYDTRVRIYALRSAPMAQLRGWLDTAYHAWSVQLAAFAEHVAHEEHVEREETAAPADGPGAGAAGTPDGLGRAG
jgi:DNA-binding transcriptional ArsR family regulator